MSILHRVGTTPGGARGLSPLRPVEGREGRRMLALRRALAELPEKEQFILTVTENGYGKRSSAYEYRRTNRGGQGITNIDTSERNGCVVASFPAPPGRAADAGHRPGQDDPHDRRRYPDRGTQHDGCDHLPCRRQRACRQRRQDRGERRGRDRARGRRRDRSGEDAVIGESELEKPADPEQE